MRVLKVLSVACALGFVSVAAQAQNVGDEFQVPVTDRFIEGEVGGSGEFRRIYAFLWDVIVVNDRIAVCGVGYFREPRARTVVNQSLRNATISLNGEVIQTGIQFFSRAMTSRRMPATPATCVLTAAAFPRGGVDIELFIGGGTIRN